MKILIVILVLLVFQYTVSSFDGFNARKDSICHASITFDEYLSCLSGKGPAVAFVRYCTQYLIFFGC